MSWTEVSPGRYQRPLGDNEKFIKLIGDRAHPLGREHWSVTSKSAFNVNGSLPGSELIRKCQDAWLSLRFEHPSIASYVEDVNVIYEVPDASALNLWVEETFFTHAEVGMNDLLASLKPSRFVTAHLLLSENALVLHFPHWRTDGYGALQLQNALMRQLALALGRKNDTDSGISWGKESSRLVPSIEELLDLSDDAKPEVVETAKKYLSTVALMRGSVGLSDSEGVSPETLPRGTRTVRTQFTEDETNAIERSCATRKISVTAAVQASCAAATRTGAPPDSQDKPYTSTIRLSLRPFMPEPWNGVALAAGICTGGYMAQTPASSSWLENAEYYSKLYDEGVTDDFLSTRREYAKQVLSFQTQAPVQPPPVFSEIDISGVEGAEGLVERSHQSNGEIMLEVRDISVGVETLSRQMYCFLWTFRGQLQLMLVYNEAFYGEARSSRLLQRLRNVLETQLDVA